ncbi:MAG TPA: hypothetical protein EYP56_05460 [Planctomycetaceae bacterium]|nr:hypothetical protein [Planctomycetaceae bacterium]
MSWYPAEVRFRDGTVLYATYFSSVGVASPVLYCTQEEASEIAYGIGDLPPCACDPEPCVVTATIDNEKWEATGCRKHKFLFGPLEPRTDGPRGEVSSDADE